MQSQEEKLRLFLEAINSYAEKQRLRILYEMERYTGEELDKAESEALRDAYIHISKETAEVRASIVRELSAHELSARHRLFEERTAIENDIFARAEKRIAAFVSSGEYDRYLTSAAGKVAGAVSSGEVTVRIRPADERKAALLGALIPGCRVETDPAIRLGGFTAEVTARGVLIDMTLDSRLEQQREVFRRQADLSADLTTED